MLNEKTEIAWALPLQPSAEAAALKRFHRDVTWTGRVRAVGGVPEMTAVGRGTFRWEVGGLWVVGAFKQDQYYQAARLRPGLRTTSPDGMPRGSPMWRSQLTATDAACRSPGKLRGIASPSHLMARRSAAHLCACE